MNYLNKKLNKLIKNYKIKLHLIEDEFCDFNDEWIAYYDHDNDCIKIFLPAVVMQDYDLNHVIMHELMHSTGAHHRLNRGIFASKGQSERYLLKLSIREEIVAELGVRLLSKKLNIPLDKVLHKRQLKIYKYKNLKHNKKELKEAKRAVEYLMSYV